ncbi:LuxR C-terminal-related transcriptional regulator [Achromobacter marplatensis]|uniref:response regulator transcription factor n=1 Tax=Achromobacter marplatensis TaxID=470868 RepID=UPI003C740209
MPRREGLAAADEPEGQADQALAPVLRALELAAPERFVRAFVDEGVEIEDLVRRARSKGMQVEFCDQLLEAFERARGGSPVPLLENPLTRREKEVLERIESGLSNKEIARALYVSESTVKSHVNRLYRKLGVKSRTQALAVARDLRLF